MAIPAYQRYQDTAARNALTNSLNNIGKAQVACGVLEDNCWTLQDIDVACADCVVSTPAMYPWCVHAENDGNMACLTISGRTASPVIGNTWELPTCGDFTQAWNCTAAGTGTVLPGQPACPFSCSAPTATDCTGAMNPSNLACGGTATQPTGTCSTSAGTCS